VPASSLASVSVPLSAAEFVFVLDGKVLVASGTPAELVFVLDGKVLVASGTPVEPPAAPLLAELPPTSPSGRLLASEVAPWSESGKLWPDVECWAWAIASGAESTSGRSVVHAPVANATYKPRAADLLVGFIVLWQRLLAYSDPNVNLVLANFFSAHWWCSAMGRLAQAFEALCLCLG
jgi:hypothetical protein